MAKKKFHAVEHSATIEEAVAKYRAREVRFSNGVTITQGELDDMPDESRGAFVSNMLASTREDIEENQ
jgi:hypothetical protein